MAVTVKSFWGPGTAAMPAGAEPTMTTAAALATTSTYRTALRNASIPSPTTRPAKCILVTQSEEGRRRAVRPRRKGLALCGEWGNCGLDHTGPTKRPGGWRDRHGRQGEHFTGRRSPNRGQAGRHPERGADRPIGWRQDNPHRSSAD